MLELIETSLIQPAMASGARCLVSGKLPAFLRLSMQCDCASSIQENSSEASSEPREMPIHRPSIWASVGEAYSQTGDSVNTAAWNYAVSSNKADFASSAPKGRPLLRSAKPYECHHFHQQPDVDIV